MAPGMKLPLILIEVNARSDPKSNLDTSPAYTTIFQQAGPIQGRWWIVPPAVPV